MHHGARPDVWVVDDRERALALATGGDGGGVPRQHPGPRIGRRGEDNGEALGLILALKRQLRGRWTGPPRRGRDDDLGGGRSGAAVGDGDRKVAGASGRRSTVDRPHDEVGGHRDVERLGDEDRAPDLADLLVAIAVHHFAAQRDRGASDREPECDVDRRWLERQAAPGRRDAGPVVQRAGKRPAQEIRLRAGRVGGHAEREATCCDGARGGRGGRGGEAFDRPARRRAHLHAVQRDRGVAPVRDARLHLQPLTGRDDAVVRGAVDRDAGGRSDGPPQYVLLLAVAVAELSQRPREQGDEGARVGGVEHRPGRVDQHRGVGRAGEQRIDAGEYTAASPIRRPPPVPPLDKRQPREVRPGPLELPLVLRAVLAPAGHGDLVIRPALDRVELPRVEAQRGGRGVDVQRAVQLHRPPARVAQHLERLARQHAGDLVVTVPVARRTGEDGNDDLGSKPPHYLEYVAEQRVAGPEAQGFVDRLGIAEVVRAREELAGAVDPPGGEQLLRADDAELGAELGADQVLSPFAAGERQIGHLSAEPPGEEGDQIRVLVVGVRPDHEDALVGAELLQGAGQRRDATGAGRGELSRGRTGGADDQGEASREGAPH